MSYAQKIEAYLASSADLLRRLDAAPIDAFLEVLAAAREAGRTIYIFGNGGSGATASHIACDLNKGATNRTDKRFRLICLNDNVPTMMAYANDVSYDDIFVEPLRNLLDDGDVVIGISGSGNSENVIRAIDYANERGNLTVGLCGYSGGRLKAKAKVAVHIDVNDMQKTEDVHLMLGHIAMQAFCGKL